MYLWLEALALGPGEEHEGAYALAHVDGDAAARLCRRAFGRRLAPVTNMPHGVIDGVWKPP